MKRIIKKYLTNALILHLLNLVVPAMQIGGGWQGLFYAAFILTVLMSIVKPLTNIIIFPLNFLTLNSTSWVVHMILFYVWTFLSPQVSISDWRFPGVNTSVLVISELKFASWQTIILCSILLIIIQKFIDWLVK